MTRAVAPPALAVLLVLGMLGALPPSPAHAAEPVDGGQTSGDVLFPNVGNGGYDVQHYDLDLAWTPDTDLTQSTIDATTTIDAITTGAPLRTFSLDFEYPEMTVSSVTVDGVAAEFGKDEDVSAVKHKLVVMPAEPVDGPFTTVVEYAGIPTSHQDADGSLEGWNATDDGATFLNQPIGSMTGFPNNNTPSDKATYTIDVDIPDTITNDDGPGDAAVASNGELVDTVGSGAGRTTWRWQQDEPMASELVLISIGKYDVLESEVTLASGRTLPEWSFVDSATTPARRAAIDAQRDRWKAVLDRLETRFGPYPGNSIGVVVDLVSGGINYALETQDRSFFPTSIGSSVFVHELTHQWYGDAVAPLVWNDIWLNEGMATWMPVHDAEPGSTEELFHQSWRDVAASSPAWTVPPAGMTDPADLYDFQTYSRGAQMWEALRLTIGDDAFFELLREWPARYTGQSRGRAAFTALAEDLSGRDLDVFFRDWLLDPDKPAWPLTDTPTPRLRGVQRVGRVLMVDNGDWAGDVTVRWLRGTVPIPGANRRTYTLGPADLGRHVVARVTYTRPRHTTVTKLARTGTVRPGVQTRRPVPRVTGRARVGEVLTAVPGAHDPGVRVRYQWLANGDAVPGATGRTFRIPARYRGDHLRVRTIASKTGFLTVTKTSAATAKVV